MSKFRSPSIYSDWFTLVALSFERSQSSFCSPSLGLTSWKHQLTITRIKLLPTQKQFTTELYWPRLAANVTNMTPISKPTNVSSALIRAPVSSYEGKKSKSNEGKKLGYTFWKVLLESSTRGVATSVNIHIGFSDTWYPFFRKPIGPETYSQHLI